MIAIILAAVERANVIDDIMDLHKRGDNDVVPLAIVIAIIVGVFIYLHCETKELRDQRKRRGFNQEPK